MLEGSGLQNALREQKSERNRQVESRTFLANVCRSQVDDDAGSGKGETGVANRRTHPFARLLHGGVGKSDDHHAGQPPGYVDFDLYRVGVYT